MSPDEGDVTFVETTPTDDVIEGSTFPRVRWARLHTTGSACSAQPAAAKQLMLGVEVQNSGAVPIQLRAVRGSFPLGLLRTEDAAVGDCDNAGIPVPGSWVAAGASTWLRLTVDVLAHCPTWAPVEFQVDYQVNGALASMSLAGFPDLGAVAYSGC